MPKEMGELEALIASLEIGNDGQHISPEKEEPSPPKYETKPTPIQPAPVTIDQDAYYLSEPY